ncbi:MAG: monofunctional biosynthetic peptidoglycan transglycosylase [Deltaproteobacteria bacterium]|nr:monofunctional biosynthetic peptidoglycan transglycosylase [Deltaproteobacteria bacterium]
MLKLLRKWRTKPRKRYVFWLVAALAAALVLPLLWSLVYPPLGGLAQHNPTDTAFMAFRRDQAADAGKKYPITWRWVPLSRISPYLVQAVLIAEDDKFFAHDGFDWEAIRQAVETNLEEGCLKLGASTVSQQLARNLFLSPDKNLLRKAREAVLTWRLENALNKKRILEIYLNVAEWGRGIFGAEAAARHYFHSPAATLAPLQAARLAAILPSPLRYSPTGSSRFVNRRAERILHIMQKRGLGKIW